MAVLYDGNGNAISIAGNRTGTAVTLEYANSVHCVNHTGYSATAPENTLPAYRESAIQGFAFVEADIRFTADGVGVLLHDASINRTARNADGTELTDTINIADTTHEQALEYDFGIWKSDDYAGTKIPTVKEFVLLCKYLNLQIYFDIKASAQEYMESLVDVVRECGMERRVSYIGNITALTYIKNYDKFARVGVLGNAISNTVTSNIIEQAEGLRTGNNEVFFDLWYEYTSEDEILLVQNAGFPLEFFTFYGEQAIMTEAVEKYPYITGWTSNTVNFETLLKELGTA